MATLHQRSSATLHQASMLSDSAFLPPSSSSSTSFFDSRVGSGSENKWSNKTAVTMAKIELKIINEQHRTF
ncbi:hypothetical protein U1Q18_046502 [Sarracenia purpurea var. burkii]